MAGEYQYPYYEGKPEGFVQSADIYFELDTGELLPGAFCTTLRTVLGLL